MKVVSIVAVALTVSTVSVSLTEMCGPSTVAPMKPAGKFASKNMSTSASRFSVSMALLAGERGGVERLRQPRLHEVAARRIGRKPERSDERDDRRADEDGDRAPAIPTEMAPGLVGALQ